ncbi:UDP-N-acetylmuramoyl-L-alanine--D-glutamate ligase [Candidatus Peregrinibacteria bacterium]|nr:UDP-N-acetylmuramoyl-L-alanine--D-glutamate ligase [Candidatus Peregrinibacteria bacterium]
MNLSLKEPIAILGFGVEGQSAFAFLKAQGLKDITICDKNSNLKAPLSKFREGGAEGEFGPHYLKDLSRFKTIIRSPGVPFHTPEIQTAIRLGAHVTSMTWLTMKMAADRTTAITGSNGKTTTTALTAEILRRYYGKRLIVGGNDRTPILTEALHRPADPILIEASSFQFIDLTISPYISAVLNITPNHLDWHANVEEYVQAKNNLIKHQKKEDWAILNMEDENTARLAEEVHSQLFTLGQSMGDNWAIWKKDQLVVCFDAKVETLLTKKELQVKTHPINFLCAAAIGVLHQMPLDEIRLAMINFKGVEHRLEFIREVSGIHFYNDSSCTTPESVLVAIQTFAPEHLILMLGGSSKKADFTELAQTIVDKKIRVYLYGHEGAQIQKTLSKLGGGNLILAYNQTRDFRQIVQDVHKKAKPQDSIVLSPACASFDMFKNAKERGKLFNEIVKEL